jgi:hypothetical protein
MTAFEVSVNGHRLFLAGTGGILSTIVTSVAKNVNPSNDGLHFRLGGIDPSTGEHVDWAVPDLRVGDEVTVRIVETDRVDTVSFRKIVTLPGLIDQLSACDDPAANDDTKAC